jgi:acetyl-CoA synthetase
MHSLRRLDNYHFYEDEWESYDELCDNFEWEVPEEFNIANYVCDRWSDQDKGVAVFSEDYSGNKDEYRFTDLTKMSDTLANYLSSELRVDKGDRIGVLSPQKLETLLAHLAILKIGAVSVPLSTLFGTDGLRYRLDDCDAKACFVDAETVDTFRESQDQLDSIESTITIDVKDTESGEANFWDVVSGSDEEYDTARTLAEDDAMIIYTSGTTGKPKGVRHAHRFLLGHLPLFVTWISNMEMRPDDRIWTPSEWAWIGSLLDFVLCSLYYGQPILAYEDEGKSFDAEKTFSLIDSYNITKVFLPPTGIRMMMQVDKPKERFDLSHVRVIPTGGEEVGESITEWADEVFPEAQVQTGYGQTEANMIIGECEALFQSKLGSLGRPGPGHEITIVDPDTGTPVKEPDTIGEIALQYADNPICFKEYLNRPKATDQKIEEPWLFTEDLGKRDENGYFYYHSRKDDVIISAGHKMGPGEIEESISKHEAVTNAGVIGIADERRDEVPKAFVVIGEEYDPSPPLSEKLQDHVRENLGKHQYPREIEFVEELPKTVTGKIRRQSLREREEQRGDR